MATATENGVAPVAPVALVPSEKDRMEFTPFMSQQAIVLSVKIVQDMICVPTKSGKVCDYKQALRFMMLCRARLLNPFEGDAYLIGYDSNEGPTFSLITSHQAFLKRAENNSEYNGMESGVIVKDEDGNLVEREGDFMLEKDVLLGAWAVVHFKVRKFPCKKRLNLTTFRKNYGRWRDDPAGMIVKCAEADALRSAFPTMLGGMYVEGEMLEAPEGLGEAPKGNRRVTKGNLNINPEQPEPTEPMPKVDLVKAIEGEIDAAQAAGDLAELRRIEDRCFGPEPTVELDKTQASIVLGLLRSAKEALGAGSGQLFNKSDGVGQ